MSRQINEERTRKEMTDPQLEQAGWYLYDRSYQHEAIRRVGEAFANGKRKALIVIATATGKTRTTMGLIDVFTRSNPSTSLRTGQARRVLFTLPALINAPIINLWKNE